jgi:hypothetical protein
MDSLNGKTALITGAAKRIGREIALTLADRGVNIAIHYRSSADEASALLDDLKSKGVKAWAVAADFEKPEERDSLIDHALAVAGSLDILVNSASTFPADTLADVTFASVVTNMEVNAWTPFSLCRDFKEKVGKGKIINMLDSRIHGEDWSHVGYILSKHVLATLTRMIALDYAPDITVNAIAPGLILPPPGKPQEYIENLAGTLPLQKHGDPKDVSQAVAFLLESDFITGQIIYVDGGRHVREGS